MRTPQTKPLYRAAVIARWCDVSCSMYVACCRHSVQMNHYTSVVPHVRTFFQFSKRSYIKNWAIHRPRSLVRHSWDRLGGISTWCVSLCVLDTMRLQTISVLTHKSLQMVPRRKSRALALLMRTKHRHDHGINLVEGQTPHEPSSVLCMRLAARVTYSDSSVCGVALPKCVPLL